MIIKRLIVPMTLAVAILHAGQALAQIAFPAPLSGGLSDACMKEFTPLRKEWEDRGRPIIAASQRHAPRDEACKLIGSFRQAELKIIKYVETNLAKCGIPPEIADQLKASHSNTEVVHKRVCALARARSRMPAGPVGDFEFIR